MTGASKLTASTTFALAGLVFAASPPGGAAALSDAPPAFRDELRSGGFGPEMVVIPAGRFHMGCDYREAGCPWDRHPPREVVFAAPFAMSKHEVTFDDYDRFLRVRAKRRRDGEADDQGWGRGRRPVINVTWDEAVAYAAWLSAQTGARYRLPSEAEWEYAARAGTTTKWPWGDEFEPARANFADGGGPSWQGDRTVPVGMFPPNAWGLHDMLGNAGEMLFDCFSIGYEEAPTDGSARTVPGTGRVRGLGRVGRKDENGECVFRVARGGCWAFDAVTSSTRGLIARGHHGSVYGIRVARDMQDIGDSGEDVTDA